MTRPPRPASASAAATACGSCGELVQGVLPDGTQFQVTLPVDLFSTAHVEIAASAGTAVAVSPARCTKAARAAALAASSLSPETVRITLSITSSIPVGVGLGSSTADVVAAVRATAAALGRPCSAGEIGRIAGTVEPSDGTMHPGVCVTDRRGRLLEAWPWWPAFEVVVLVPEGPQVPTDKVDLAPQARHAGTYAGLLHDLRAAVARRDPRAFVEAAATSAALHQPIVENRLLAYAPALCDLTGAAGWNVAHTGTALGLLFHDAPAARLAAARLRADPRMRPLRMRPLRLIAVTSVPTAPSPRPTVHEAL